MKKSSIFAMMLDYLQIMFNLELARSYMRYGAQFQAKDVCPTFDSAQHWVCHAQQLLG